MRLTIHGTPVYEATRQAVSNPLVKIIVLRGGTRSSKTYSVMQMILTRLVSGNFGGRNIKRGVCSVVRKYASTLKGTVMRDFKEILLDSDLGDMVLENKTDKTFYYAGRLVEFIGADDQHKLKGGKRNILYCNESNELQFKKEFFQLLIRTKDIAIVDLNPDDPDIWINTELEQKRAVTKKDVTVIVSTYKDNRYLSPEEVAEIEYIKYVDPELWKVYGLGQYGKIMGTIFNNWEVIPELPPDAKYVGHGMDFGYTHDPSTLIGLYLYNNCLVLDEEIYERGLTNIDIYDNQGGKISMGNSIDGRMGEAWLNKWDIIIIADSSEPKSIAELEWLGWDIRGVTKWADSIRFGLNILGRYKILITARSRGTISEFKKYKRALDKDGKSLNKPIDKFNHAIDGARYAAMELLWWLDSEPDIFTTEEEDRRLEEMERKKREQMEKEELDADIF